MRENRLYQADWLMRFYGIPGRRDADERTLRSIWRSTPAGLGPCGIPNTFRSTSTAPTTRCLPRVPGIGVKSARLIVASLLPDADAALLKQIGVVMKKAQYFHPCRELGHGQGSTNSVRRCAPPAHCPAAAEIR